MITAGFILRHSVIPKKNLSILYLGIGLALVLSSVRYIRVFFKVVRSSRDVLSDPQSHSCLESTVFSDIPPQAHSARFPAPPVFLTVGCLCRHHDLLSRILFDFTGQAMSSSKCLGLFKLNRQTVCLRPGPCVFC